MFAIKKLDLNRCIEKGDTKIHRISIDERQREWDRKWWTSANCSIPPGESNLNAEWIGISMCVLWTVYCVSVCDSTFTIHSIKWPSQLMIWTIWKDDTRTTHFKLNKCHTSKRCECASKCLKSNCVPSHFQCIAYTLFNQHLALCCCCRTAGAREWRSLFNLFDIRRVCWSRFTNSKSITANATFFSTHSCRIHSRPKRIEQQMQKQPAASQSQPKSFSFMHTRHAAFLRNSISESRVSQSAWTENKNICVYLRRWWYECLLARERKR